MKKEIVTKRGELKSGWIASGDLGGKVRGTALPYGITMHIYDRIRTIYTLSRSDGCTEVSNCIAWLLVLSSCFLLHDWGR